MMHTLSRRVRVLYLYAGSRKAFYEKWERGLVPDTQLLGLNYMQGFGIDAEYKEWRVPEFLRRINFNLVHLSYILAIKKYDLVFICAGLPLVFLAKYILRWKKPRLVIYNTFLAHALARNPHGIGGFITRKAIENLDMIVCTARAQVAPLIAAGIAPEKIKFVPIGIDAQKFVRSEGVVPSRSHASPPQRGGSLCSARRCQEPSQSLGSLTNHAASPAQGSLKGLPLPPYILSVGRDLGRDYKTLFEAVRGLDRQVVVATKPEAVAGLTPPPNVEVRFHVPYEDMPALYAGALCVVTPLKASDNPDGSETSGQYGFLEPMAAGKAVIATDKPSVRDYIEHEKTGLLVEPENPAALRAAIHRLTGKAGEPMRKTLGLQAQKAVLENFTSKHWAHALAEIFKSFLKG